MRVDVIVYPATPLARWIARSIPLFPLIEHRITMRYRLLPK
jgi:hypothetical protein